MNWEKVRVVGSAWNQFQQIIPVGDGVILVFRPDGKLRWYKDRGLTSPNAITRLKQTWDGPVELGSGWQDFSKVFALMPSPPPVIR